MTGKTGYLLRKQHHRHGIQPGTAGAQRDQGIHIGIVTTQRLPGPGIEVVTGVDQYGERGDPDTRPEQ
jgi:hypothetical protein